MTPTDCATRYCIIGAGSSGITAAKHLKQLDIPFDCFEREDDIGGNWYYGKPNSSVYRSTHLISSKPLTEYADYPMPAAYPDYPSHAQVLAYFHAYVEHFGLRSCITFNTAVDKVAPAGELWDVTLSTGETRRYRGVIICNGHNWLPKYYKRNEELWTALDNSILVFQGLDIPAVCCYSGCGRKRPCNWWNSIVLIAMTRAGASLMPLPLRAKTCIMPPSMKPAKRMFLRSTPCCPIAPSTN